MTGAQFAKVAALAEPVRGVWPERQTRERPSSQDKSRKRRRARATRVSVGRGVLILGTVAVLMGLIGWRAVYVARSGQQIIEWKEELRLLDVENRRLEAQILESQSPQRVEADARTRLGMQPAEAVRPVSVDAAQAGRPGISAGGGETTHSVIVALAPDTSRRPATGRVQAGADPLAAITGLARVVSSWVANYSGFQTVR